MNRYRTYRGRITYSWTPTADMELSVEIDYIGEPAEPATRDYPGAPATCELRPVRVYVSTKGQPAIEFKHGPGFFDELLSLDAELRDEIETLCGEDAAGREEAALNHHLESIAELRRKGWAGV